MLDIVDKIAPLNIKDIRFIFKTYIINVSAVFQSSKIEERKFVIIKLPIIAVYNLTSLRQFVF